MTPPLHLVAVSGGLQRTSRAASLCQHLMQLIGSNLACQPHLVELGQVAPQLAGATWRNQLPATVERELAAVEQADILVVATPVYRGSYTGLFKHFFDFIDQDALVDTPILLAATGGSERHSLVIDHQLRPLFSFFQARTLPIGVYATDSDFLDGCVHSPALLQRSELAVQRGLPLLELAARRERATHNAAAVA